MKSIRILLLIIAPMLAFGAPNAPHKKEAPQKSDLLIIVENDMPQLEDFSYLITPLAVLPDMYVLKDLPSSYYVPMKAPKTVRLFALVTHPNASKHIRHQRTC